MASVYEPMHRHQQCTFEGSLSCKVVVDDEGSILIVYTASKQLENKYKQTFGDEKPILCNQMIFKTASLPAKDKSMDS